MKKPLLKKIWSYFDEVLIEESSSEFNPILEIILTKGRYQLATDTAIYSFEDKYDNFLKAFEAIDIKKINPNEVLLLGLGLGSIPFMLENIFDMRLQYTAVEIDEEICRLAEKYTLCHLESTFQVYPMDAKDYLKFYDQKFDMIAADIFQSSIIPSEFESIQFFEQLSDKLNENGIILYNRLADSPAHEKKNESFWKRWKSFFPDADRVNTGTNIIYLNRNIRVHPLKFF